MYVVNQGFHTWVEVSHSSPSFSDVIVWDGDKAWEFLDLWTSESGHIHLPFGVTASKVWDAELWQGTGILICMQKNTRVQNCYSGATLFLRTRVPTGSYN